MPRQETRLVLKTSENQGYFKSWLKITTLLRQKPGYDKYVAKAVGVKVHDFINERSGKYWKGRRYVRCSDWKVYKGSLVQVIPAHLMRSSTSLVDMV